MTRKQKRLTIIVAGVGMLAMAATLILFALRQEIVFFKTPSDLIEAPVARGVRLRLGGLVEDKSLMRGQGKIIRFVVTDKVRSINVSFEGILPDLFREGQGVVAEGSVDADGTFVADSVLAKHDENYMPKEVAESLKAKGVWQGQ